MSSTSNGALGTATNLVSGDASAALGNNLIKGNGISISDNDSPMEAFLAPGMNQLLGGSGGSSGGGSSGKLAQTPQQTNNGPSVLQTAPFAANTSTLSALSNTGQQGSAMQSSSGGQQASINMSPLPLTNTGVGSSQLGGGMISSNGQPTTLYQMLTQNGRASSGY